MTRMLQTSPRLVALLAFGLVGSAHAAGVASLSGSFDETVDSMGTAGTAAPLGWSLFQGNSGTSNATWSTSIPGNGTNSVASMVATSGALSAVTTPSGTNNNGFNAALSSVATGDRVLATSPTTVTGAAIQLALENDSGSSFSSLTLSYDTVRLTTASSAEELPGYWLFYSLDGSSWTNVAALNPTIASVPNTSIGVGSVTNATVNLGTSVASGSTLYLRWVDDNGKPTSPDQILALNNVQISAVPEPSTTALLLAGLGLAGVSIRRRRTRG